MRWTLTCIDMCGFLVQWRICLVDSWFFGKIRWHSRMIQHLALFATPLHAAEHHLPFQWTSVEDEAYQALKLMLSHAPVVQPPVRSKPFHVFVDASDIAFGSALIQCTPPNWYRPVYYASRRLSAAEKNYSNIHQFRHYLLGRKFTFHVDHSALLYLVNKQALTGRLAQWMLLWQEFDFHIQHRPGVCHDMARLEPMTLCYMGWALDHYTIHCNT